MNSSQTALKTPAEGLETPEASDLYGRYCRPKLVDLLKSMKLDVAYDEAAGSYVYYHDDGGRRVPVLDLVSGFGAALLGHNNPELKEALKDALDGDLPVLTQSAVRPGAAALGRRLNQLIPAEGRYLCNLTNSGAEAVEAALKHAYKVRFDAVRKTYERISRQTNELFEMIEREQLQVELPDAGKGLRKFRDDLDELNVARFEELRQAPVVLALKGSFHGKTSAALKVTFNKSYREGYEGLSAIHPVFVDPRDVHRLPELVAEQSVEFLVPHLEQGKVVLDRVTETTVIAFIFEVIMGEGGIRLLSDQTLSTLARLHPELGAPYIIDEVQTGCGRTGAMFAYAETPLASIEPEYVTLSKALGGGLVKIGATLIHQRVYDPDFGILHTSTFAEDDLSCVVAYKALEILTRNRGRLMEDIGQQGSYLLRRLRRLQQRYPRVVKEVRGRGLMIGVELRQLQHLSPFFRYAGKQGFCSLLVTSYLLHHHRIRVLAPLTTLLKGNPGKRRQSVLRIQPTAHITREEMDRVVAALEEVFRIIHNNNEYLLVAHLIGEIPCMEQRRAPVCFPVTLPLPPRREDFDARVGFVIHPTALAHLAHYYFPSLSRYPWSRSGLARWWSGLSRFLEPDVVHVEYIEHDGFVVEVNFVAVPFLPETMVDVFTRARAGRRPDRECLLRLQEVRDKVQDAVTVARELGDDHVPTSMVGLGAFTSIVTGQGTTINDYEVPVTTGNAYTTGLMIQGVERAAGIQGLNLERATCAVVGAAGNIGSAMAAMLCARGGHVMLVGHRRDSGLARLEQVRGACMLHILERARALAGEELGGLARTIYQDVLGPCLEGGPPASPQLRELRLVARGEAPLSQQHGPMLDEVVAAHYGGGENPFVSLHTDLQGVATSDVVAVATNSTSGRLITPDTVKRGAVVCSASVPSDLCRWFADQMQDYFVFDGGFASLPPGNRIDWVGMPRGGLAFGCLSETLLMGFDGKNRTFAKGALSARQVQATLELAQQYGFSLGELELAQAALPATESTTHQQRSES